MKTQSLFKFQIPFLIENNCTMIVSWDWDIKTDNSHSLRLIQQFPKHMHIFTQWEEAGVSAKALLYFLYIAKIYQQRHKATKL